MYRRLVVTYGALCCDCNTPLTMVWEDEKDVKSINEQQSLRALYLRWQPAFQQFCTV